MKQLSKKRLDIYLLERNPSMSRAFIQSMIMQGNVSVDGVIVTKAGHLVDEEQKVILQYQEPAFVSRAGYKLEKALTFFDISVENKICMDAGLSTGGFTDCLLKHGAKHVYGIDVGYGQVHEKIRKDPRVTVMERVNLRHVTTLPEPIDVVTLDLSFISVLKVMDAVSALLRPNGLLIVLIKPQFEATKADIGKGGIVRDPGVHERVIEAIKAGIAAYGFTLLGITESPILGTDGNKEFLGAWHKK